MRYSIYGFIAALVSTQAFLYFNPVEGAMFVSWIAPMVILSYLLFDNIGPKETNNQTSPFLLMAISFSIGCGLYLHFAEGAFDPSVFGYLFRNEQFAVPQDLAMMLYYALLYAPISAVAMLKARELQLDKALIREFRKLEKRENDLRDQYLAKQ